MKKTIANIFIIIFILFSCISISHASSLSVNFSAEATSVLPGETFDSKVTISDIVALNGIQFALDFDENIFELQEVKLADSDNYVLFGDSAKSIEILNKQGNNIPLVINISLKVKENAKSRKLLYCYK